MFIATPGPGTYVAPSAFGYYVSDKEMIMAIGGVELSPKLQDRLLLTSTKASRRNSNYTRLSQGLSASQDRVMFKTKRTSSNPRAQSVPRGSSTAKRDLKLDIEANPADAYNVTKSAKRK